MARLPDASRKAEEYAALGMFQEAAETAATVSTQPFVLCHLLVITASEYLDSIEALICHMQKPFGYSSKGWYKG